MKQLEFWKAVTVDREDFLERFVALLEASGASYCVIGGQGVNAYVEPVVSLDLDVVIAADSIDSLTSELAERFHVERFEHSINVSASESSIRVQIQTDPRYFAFLPHSAEHDVLGMTLRVARVEDVLQGKVWAVLDSSRRASKRQKDLADISRLLEASPELRERIPEEILSKLL